ncbi:hypothetical protein SAMN05660748_2187 [Blastococcus aggregatus]|uniref:NACHT domain-containing protein n=1 Tax=Blastococcus aggregatus TaxID=38502 RepID=A0A285V5W5_9ACTN|nr:hypothetical protein [Blastococcus aggregatus]SOC49460.1 hypothetical protein SAMN05660748_2187 [Blastococcus aggregatus]
MASSGSYKYLYERLGADRFQQLCAALVVESFEDVAVFPVHEKDGGRDMVSGTGENRTILQVKWTGTRNRKPASWLKAQVKGEADNIKRLVGEGCKRYILMTNVEGSATPGSGARDDLDGALKELSKTYGVEMSCLWASDLDAWVDLAPFELKAAYVDMLAGTDALFALLRSELLQEREKREKDILVTYVATHWDRDKRVKFRQVDLSSDLLTDLFVDVAVRRVRSPRNLALPAADLGGVAKHLLNSQSPPLTLIEGVPGQGKSTLAQYVCQVYRAGFIGRKQLAASKESLPVDETEDLRVSIRIDLADYAEWISGHDPFSASDTLPKRTKERSRIDLELFLVDHLAAGAPGHDIRLDDVRSILDRFSTLVILDGLDEVAASSVRAKVVRTIDEFTTRWAQARPGNMRIIVTTRPNGSGLPEPAPDIFDKLVLRPLDEATKKRYLRRWAAAQHLDGSERRTLERVFGEHTASPHVAQLADNPMQLTILLHLIRIKGESMPTARTSLYRSYMDLFLEREAAKSKVVLESRADLEEATSYLGWLMQALTEVDASSTRLPAQRIVRELKAYLAVVEKATAPVQSLFEAMRDRVWVLTSKHSGTYEFDVQSIREFFAARFLYDFAEADTGHDFTPEGALVELLPRPYWANTARFLGGHFPPRLLPEVAELIEARFGELSGARQVRTTVWSLLSDGIFKERASSQRRVAELFADELAVRLLAPEISRRTSVPDLPKEFGGLDLAARLRNDITADVTSLLTPARSSIAATVGDPDEFNIWWASELGTAAGTAKEAHWLAVGRPLASGQHLPPSTVEALAMDTPEGARAAIAAGVSPEHSSKRAKRLLDWTLAGHCSDVSPQGTSEASDLLRVVAPHVLLTKAAGEALPGRLGIAGHPVTVISQEQRTAALRRLAERHGGDQLKHALRAKAGEKGTTSQWVNTARTLCATYGGPCWLATEIAAIGAALHATEFRTGGGTTKDAPCFGTDMDYGQWLPAVRQYRARHEWWEEQRTSCTDDHARAAWVLGALAVANSDVVTRLLPTISGVVADLPHDALCALVATSSRIAASGLPRRLSTAAVDKKTPAAVRLLLAHYADDLTDLLLGDTSVLHEAARFPVGAWPATQVVTRRALKDPSDESLALVELFGLSAMDALPLDSELPIESAEHILRHPDRYSTTWLTVADQSLTTRRYDQPLKSYVDAHWGI